MAAYDDSAPLWAIDARDKVETRLLEYLHSDNACTAISEDARKAYISTLGCLRRIDEKPNGRAFDECMRDIDAAIDGKGQLPRPSDDAVDIVIDRVLDRCKGHPTWWLKHRNSYRLFIREVSSITPINIDSAEFRGNRPARNVLQLDSERQLESSMRWVTRKRAMLQNPRAPRPNGVKAELIITEEPAVIPPQPPTREWIDALSDYVNISMTHILEALYDQEYATMGNGAIDYGHDPFVNLSTVVVTHGAVDNEDGRSDDEVRRLLERADASNDEVLMFFAMVGGENVLSHHRSVWWKEMNHSIRFASEERLCWDVRSVMRQLRAFSRQRVRVIKKKEDKKSEARRRKQERKRQKKQRNRRRY